MDVIAILSQSILGILKPKVDTLYFFCKKLDDFVLSSSKIINDRPLENNIG